MTNLEVNRFLNDTLRPLAHKARALRAEIRSMEIRWYAGMNTKVPNSLTTPIDDGREAEGITTLMGSDVVNLVGNLIAMKDAGNEEIIEKPSIGTLKIN
jgi:hypothetical protein